MLRVSAITGIFFNVYQAMLTNMFWHISDCAGLPLCSFPRAIKTNPHQQSPDTRGYRQPCLLLLVVALYLYANNAIAATQSSSGKPPAVVATIAPLHSLVEGLLADISPAHLLLANAASAHSYAMKPSDAKHLANADIIVQIGAGLEGFLQKTIVSVAASAELVSVARTEGTLLLPPREFKHQTAHGEQPAHNDSATNTAQSHDHQDSPYDPHLWLDPMNNLGWINELAKRLQSRDPVNAATYEKNRLALINKLKALDADMTAMLSTVAGENFIAQHDSYQYLEKRFGLQVFGVTLDSHEQRIGVASLRRLAKLAKSQQTGCIVTAPGTTASVLESVSGLAKIARVEIDILGTRLEPGPELYFQLMQGITRQLTACLGSP